jgi:hypothetical protein
MRYPVASTAGPSPAPKSWQRRPGAVCPPWGSCGDAASPGSRGRRRRGEPERRVVYTVFFLWVFTCVDAAGLERPEAVYYFSVAANVRSIRSTWRSSARSSPANPPRAFSFSSSGGFAPDRLTMS